MQKKEQAERKQRFVGRPKATVAPYGDGRVAVGERLSGRVRSCRPTEEQRSRMQVLLEMEDLLHNFVSSASS
jgi:hypothetical protein